MWWCVVTSGGVAMYLLVYFISSSFIIAIMVVYALMANQHTDERLISLTIALFDRRTHDMNVLWIQLIFSAL